MKERIDPVRYPILSLITIILIMTSITGCIEEEDEPKFESIIDIDLPSESTDMVDGTIAVRIHFPEPDKIRYKNGASVVIYGEGGADADGLINKKIPGLDDMVVVTLIFPGGENENEGRRSDGMTDYRGRRSIQALRDVILFSSGEKCDSNGKFIQDMASYPVLHDNIGFIGFSFGGNIGIGAAALEGGVIGERLKYIIQWETPVSSQIATRDLGRMLAEPIDAGDAKRTEFFNPHYNAYGPKVLDIDYSNISYDPNSIYPVFIDGNGDGIFTAVNGSHYDFPTPDLNDNGKLERNEDYGLDTYWFDTYDEDGRVVYSRPVMQAIARYNIFQGNWSRDVVSLDDAIEYWNVRESVRLYERALENIPDLKGMFLLSQDDHVQSDPYKSHVHQAYDGWNRYGSWFKINPDRDYITEVDITLSDLPLPSLEPNTPPNDWEDLTSYCIPESIKDETYQIAAVHQMSDLIHDQY